MRYTRLHFRFSTSTLTWLRFELSAFLLQSAFSIFSVLNYSIDRLIGKCSCLQLSEVETRDAELREAETEREHLQRQILDLRFQIAELQALSFEHDDAKNKVTSLQTVLDEKVRRVTSLCVVV